MWVTNAFAQDAAAPAAASTSGNLLVTLVPFLLIFVIMYFLLIRPQQQKMRAHQALIKAVRRGDTVVTSGGIIGKISKVVDDNEVELEVVDKTKLRIVRSAIAEVRAKGEPVKDEG